MGPDPDLEKKKPVGDCVDLQHAVQCVCNTGRIGCGENRSHDGEY